MASRRQVRLAAVQFLYARSASPDNLAGPEFWDLVNDRSGLGYDRTRVKVLVHLEQGREAVAVKFQNLLLDHAANILSLEPNGKLGRALKELADSEVQWAEQCGNLARLTKADTGGWRRDLESLLPQADDLRRRRGELLPRLKGLPPLLLRTICQIFEKLDTYDARARMVRFPEKHPERRELDQLHRLAGEMAKLADEARETGEAVEACRDELDEVIDSASTNFDLKRLAQVDLAILRLATWEILRCPVLDAAVSITEAVDLARAFSGEEAAAFVNGVLDKIAKT